MCLALFTWTGPMNTVVVDNVCKTYASGGLAVHAVNGVSFAVAPGQIFGLLGPNGAGKTTLVKVLTTITTPTAGHAQICGFDVQRQAMEVRRRIAVVLQQTAVEGLLTVEDNFRIYAKLHGVSERETRKRMAAVFEEFELGDKAKQAAQDLSQGTKRRIQVAKVLMTDAPVIFLDECTTGMDPFMRRRVLDRIQREARNGRSVVLTTQVLSEAEELCDHIMIIDQGRTLAAGDLQTLRRLSSQMFRVSLTVPADYDIVPRLNPLSPLELQIEGRRVQFAYNGEEALLLGTLAELSRIVRIEHFEIRGADLEDIFVNLVNRSAAERMQESPP